MGSSAPRCVCSKCCCNCKKKHTVRRPHRETHCWRVSSQPSGRIQVHRGRSRTWRGEPASHRLSSAAVFAP
jgi:hypothetical protein